MDRNEYLALCYAAFLGKAIGVRLGAPVENWSARKIAETYPQMDGYLVDYGVFAADDDTNGPLFFVRALLDDPPNTPLPEAVAHAVLNYIPDHNGFFWWGGTKISTEQTAYENLQAGILPPRSGSIAQNGKTLAEQIGGQIFSDCWGYIALGEPRRAGDMAGAAASVTHDGDGVQGARFVAACIAAAAGAADVQTAMGRALLCLDAQSEYSKTIEDIRRYHLAHPKDASGCLRHIQKTYDTPEYGGVCHILPNAARMTLALCYGQNDFSNTLLLCCACGADTDCNCGNVGSIMGALLGLQGIPERWITPINDVMLSSSCMGYRNNGSVSGGARMFASIAAMMTPSASARTPMENAFWRFTLPYETKGAVAVGGTAGQRNGALWFVPQSDEAMVFWHAYYTPGEIYDARYEPALAPLVYPGGELSFVVGSDAVLQCAAFVETDCGGRTYGSTTPITGRTTLRVSIPAGEGTVLRFGVSAKNCCGNALDIHSVRFDQRADCTIRFRQWGMDDYGPRFLGGRHCVVRGFTPHSGQWSIEDGALRGSSKDSALISTGSASFRMRTLNIAMRPNDSVDCLGVFGMQGAYRYFAAGVLNGELIFYIKHDEDTRILFRSALRSGDSACQELSIVRRGHGYRVAAMGQAFFCALPDDVSMPKGALGILLRGTGSCSVDALAFTCQ